MFGEYDHSAPTCVVVGLSQTNANTTNTLNLLVCRYMGLTNTASIAMYLAGL